MSAHQVRRHGNLGDLRGHTALLRSACHAQSLDGLDGGETAARLQIFRDQLLGGLPASSQGDATATRSGDRVRIPYAPISTAYDKVPARGASVHGLAGGLLTLRTEPSSSRTCRDCCTARWGTTASRRTSSRRWHARRTWNTPASDASARTRGTRAPARPRPGAPAFSNLVPQSSQWYS